MSVTGTESLRGTKKYVVNNVMCLYMNITEPSYAFYRYFPNFPTGK